VVPATAVVAVVAAPEGCPPSDVSEQAEKMPIRRISPSNVRIFSVYETSKQTGVHLLVEIRVRPSSGFVAPSPIM